jgi:hypothetical protein
VLKSKAQHLVTACTAVAVVQIMPEMKEAAEMQVGMAYRLMGVHDLLLSPPVEQPRNIIDSGLFMAHHKVKWQPLGHPLI